MHTHSQARIVFIALSFIALLLIAPGGAVAANGEPVATRAFITEQFLKYDPDWLRKKAPMAAELAGLQQRLYELQARGFPMQCSAQIVNETDWILDSTAEFTRAEKNLWFLRLSLGDTNQGFALEQMATDGSFGLCYDEWFKKLDAMVAALNRFSESSTPPKYTHLAVLRRISTPEMLISYLDGLLISDIAKTGVNFRDELNATASMVAEVLYKERLRNYVSDFVVHRPLTAYADVFNAFVEMWQDPETGYWGAWFQSDGQLRKSLDLSITYHIVAYRHGDVRYWDKIFDTTLAIADQEYPYGWLQNGVLTNHHAYDVARILKLGWNHVSEERRQLAKPALERLLAFGLTIGLNADDSVTPQAGLSDGIDDSYYYAASLLTTIGYCSTARPFWTDTSWPEAGARCCGLARHIEEQQARTPTIEAALERMRRAVPSCAPKALAPQEETIDNLKLDDRGGR